MKRRKYTLIFGRKSSERPETVYSFICREAWSRPSITEIGYTRLIIDAVIENLGVSLLPRFTLEEALREKKIALFSVKGFRSSMLMQVIYSKNRWVSPAMKAFIEMTKEFMPE